MCARRDPDAVYQPVADLDLEMPQSIRQLAYGDTDWRWSGAWVGAHTFYALLENV